MALLFAAGSLIGFPNRVRAFPVEGEEIIGAGGNPTAGLLAPELPLETEEGSGETADHEPEQPAPPETQDPGTILILPEDPDDGWESTEPEIRPGPEPDPDPGTAPPAETGPDSGTGSAAERISGETQDTESEAELIPALEIEDEEQQVTFRIGAELKNAVVPETFAPEIGLEGGNVPEIVSVYRNGEEIPYSFDGNKITIAAEDIVDGKNRIRVRVRDEQGTETEMEPWEFYRGDLYSEDGSALEEPGEGGTDVSIIRKTKETSGKSRIIAALAAGLLLIATGWLLVRMTGRKRKNRNEAAVEEGTEMETVTLTDE